MNPTHRKTRARAAGSLVALVAGLLSQATAFASDVAEASEGAAHHPSTGEVVAVVLNFAVLVFLIVKFGGPKIQEYYRSRRASIADAIEESRALRERAEQKLAEYSSRLDAFDAERERLLAEFREVGEREKERIIREAREQADRIREEARAQANLESRQARVELESALVDRAVDSATDELRRRLNPLMQDRLIDRSIDRFKSIQR